MKVRARVHIDPPATGRRERYPCHPSQADCEDAKTNDLPIGRSAGLHSTLVPSRAPTETRVAPSNATGNNAGMELLPESICLYVRHAFAGMNKVLDRLDDTTVNMKPPTWGTNTVAGLIVHCCELAPSWFELPGLGRESVRDRDAEFQAHATIAQLRTRIAVAAERTCAVVEEFVVGPTAVDHPLRDFMPGADRSDGALVIHVLEELFQHLGHMEVTADALT
jgi:Protein of unknown function (DUF664)